MFGLEGEGATWGLRKFNNGGYIICSFNQYYWGRHMKVNVVGGICCCVVLVFIKRSLNPYKG
jgi:hypothetical protein